MFFMPPMSLGLTRYSRAGGSGIPFDPLIFFANGEQGGLYDPSDLTTLFQDAAGTVPVTADGQPVGLMLDKSGNGNHLTQVATASRPTYRTDGTSHWLEFDGVDDRLVTSAINLTHTNKLSAISGIYRAGVSSTGILYEFTASTADALPGTFCLRSALATNRYYAGARGANGSNLTGRVADLFIDDFPDQCVLSAFHDLSGVTSKLRRNGGEMAESVVSNDGGNFGNYVLTLGNRPTTTSYFAGNLYGLIIVDNLLSDAQSSQAEKWMAAKIPTYFVAKGAWTWFNDPRVIRYADNRYAVGVVKISGGIEITDLADGVSSVSTLTPSLQKDDHCNPAVINLASGYLLAAYSGHNFPTYFVAKSTSPNSAASWDAATDIAGQLGHSNYSYANLVQLASGRIYVFYRATNAVTGDWSWHYSYSDDDGEHWSVGVQISGSARPYHKIRRNGANRIDIIVNDGHPNVTPTNGTYHFYLLDTGGDVTFHKTDGTQITNPPFDNADWTQIYDASENGRSWIWDVTIDPGGRPVVCFAAFPGSTNTEAPDHRYYQARWDGETWTHHEICSAGGDLYVSPTSTEDFYSGGVISDPADPNVIYCSRQVDDVGNISLSGTHQIFKGITYDDGETWSLEQISSGSSKCFRPYIPEGSRHLFYLAGNYTSYTSYRTLIVRVEI